jgi:ABC-2 type transport system ATP-binding protein
VSKESATPREWGDTRPDAQDAAAGPGAVQTPPEIVFQGISKFYGEVLGVNRVSLRIPPGISSLVGPNGSGKTTLMNLMAGLIRPDRGTITVRGISPRDPERLMRITGYATQYDAVPRGATGFDFVSTALLLAGHPRPQAEELAWKAIEQVDLTDAAERKVAAYSKGMRQRVRLAQAIAGDPEVLILDEPLNGLDPLVRAETIALFEKLAARGRHVVLSSHVLHEVDVISDRVVIIANGTVIAEGDVRGVRDEIHEHPRQYLIRCRDASRVAALLFEQDHVTQVQIHDDHLGLLVMTRNQLEFSRALNRIALAGHTVHSVMAADENVDALYKYLIGGGE